MTTAFVAGATGYTGREVVRALIEGGHRAVAHVRPDSNKLESLREQFAAEGAEVDATAWDEAAMTATLRELAPEVVFALLGTTRHRMDKLREGEADYTVASYEDVDYGLTALLMRACVAAEIEPRFVYLSAAGVTPGASSAYYAVRARAEQELRDSGLPYTIARPGVITGPDREEDRPLERIAGTMADGALFLAGTFGFRGLQDRYRSTDAATLARALVRLALDPDGANTVVEGEDLR